MSLGQNNSGQIFGLRIRAREAVLRTRIWAIINTTGRAAFAKTLERFRFWGRARPESKILKPFEFRGTQENLENLKHKN